MHLVQDHLVITVGAIVLRAIGTSPSDADDPAFHFTLSTVSRVDNYEGK